MAIPATALERRATRPARERLATLTLLLGVWAAGCCLLLVVILQRRVPVRDLLVDPATATGSAWYAGMVTSVGVLAWSVAACACAATAYTAALAARPRAVSAFRGAALLFGLLLLDDLFLLHSDLVPAALGLSKLTALATLASMAGLWVLTARGELRRTRWELLLASAGAFAASLGVDVAVAGPESGPRLLVEDGAKLLGVLALADWSVATARDVLRSAVPLAPDSRRQGPAGAARAGGTSLISGR